MVSSRRAGRLGRQRGWRRGVAGSRAGVRQCGARVISDAGDHVGEVVLGDRNGAILVIRRAGV
jgi:hypothetical protein